jgi:hypothetical protein
VANVKQKNIQIPLLLFKEILEFMEYMDDANLDILFADMCDSILAQLRAKQDSIALREHYSDIVLAKDEDRQHAARMLYLQMKRVYKS